VQRGARQQRPADEGHQSAREPVVRSQQAPAVAIEARQHRVPLGQIGGHGRGQPLGGDQRVRQAARRERIGGGRRVAQQDRPRGPPGPRRAHQAGSPGWPGQRLCPLQRVAQDRLVQDPAAQRPARPLGPRLLIGQAGQQQLAVGQRRRVQLVPAAHEDRQPVAQVAPAGQLEVHPRADPAPARRHIQAQRPAHARGEPVGPHHQPRATDPAADPQPDGAPVRLLDPFHLGVLEHAHAGRLADRVQQHLVQAQAPLRQGDRPGPERAFGHHAESVVADRAQRAAAHRLPQPDSVEHRHAGRKDPLATGLLAREVPRVEQVDAQPRAPEQQRQRRAGRARARNGDVGDVRPGVARV